MHRTAVLGGCIALLAHVALAAPGDALLVSGDVVNVRAGPGTEYRVQLQVYRNQRALELARDGEWVEVDLRDPVGRGWIHQSLLETAPRAEPAGTAPGAALATPETAEGGVASPPAHGAEPEPLPSTDTALAEPASASEALARFRGNVAEINARAQALAGVELFTGAEQVGSGTVQVLATEAWHLMPQAGQQSYTNALFGHWQAVSDSSETLRLQVVDPSGRVVSEKSGP